MSQTFAVRNRAEPVRAEPVREVKTSQTSRIESSAYLYKARVLVMALNIDVNIWYLIVTGSEVAS